MTKENETQLEIVSRATPIYVVGDSHCLIFRDLVFEQRGRYFVTKAKFLPALYARIFTDDESAFNAALFETLRDERLIRPDGSRAWAATHLTDSPFVDGAAGLSEQKRSAPILVFFLGGGDLFYFIKGMDAQTDFSLDAIPFDSGQFPARPISAMLDQKLVFESVGQILGPLFRGLRLLERAGFSNVYLHTIPPDTIDDREYERLSGHFAPAVLRYKSSVLFNAMLREFTRQNPRIGLIDTWDKTTVGGKRDDRFSLDGFHFNKLGARLTIEQLVRQLNGRLSVMPSPPSPDLIRVVTEASRVDESNAAPFRASAARFSDMHEMLEESLAQVHSEKERAEAELATFRRIAEERLTEIHTLTETAEQRLRLLQECHAEVQRLLAQRFP
ncbi:MAG TPA: hypothetical protein VFW34_06090 [Candidatus Rubrimentiphilum sp.]|nr:hypothetical protein [Candidatus Rubrimentiphilum sp.]